MCVFARASVCGGLCVPSCVASRVTRPAQAYWTIHVTPQSCCSYASFETNVHMASYGALIEAVLAMFAPARFTLNFFADSAVLPTLEAQPTAVRSYAAPRARYALREHSHVDFPGEYSAFLSNYEVPRVRRVASLGAMSI